MIPFTVPKLLINPSLWKFVGFGSSIVGFSCYALCPSFHDLFGKFNLLKIVIYCVVSMFLSCLMLFVNKCSGFAKSFLVKAQVGFLILTLTSLYSFWEDRASEQGNEKKGHGRIFNLSSSGAFALMSLSLSRQLQLGFEVGMFNFFLGCFLMTLMKMNFKLAPVAAFFCFVLLNIRSCSDYLLEMRGGGGESAETECADIESNSHNVDPRLRNYEPRLKISRRHSPPPPLLQPPLRPRCMLQRNGEIHVNHKTTAPFNNWNIEKLAVQSPLTLIQCADFKKEDYPLFMESVLTCKDHGSHGQR